MDEFGWDRDDRTYYVLDDNRLYRRTDPPPPPDSTWKPKSNTLKAQAARRRERKRRRTRASDTSDIHDEDETMHDGDIKAEAEPHENGTSDGYKWECVCVTLSQYKEFIEGHRKTRDENERNLVDSIEEVVMPILEKAEEAQLRKMQKREKELLNLERMATAKRSSRLADKHERERLEIEHAEAERKRAADLAAARKMEEQQRKMEEERQSRMLTREQRIREREYKRLLHEEELARMEEEAKKIEAGEMRDSRHLKASIEKRKKDLEELNNEEEWMFDCSGCGLHGKNFVGLTAVQCRAILTFLRTMALIVWLARSATLGNTANVMAYHKRKPKAMISILSARTVVAVKQKQTSRKFLPSSSVSAHPHHLQPAMRRLKLPSDPGEGLERCQLPQHQLSMSHLKLRLNLYKLLLQMEIKLACMYWHRDL